MFAKPVKVVSGLYIAKAFRSYPKWKRARDAASWVRGEVTVTPTIKLAASVFGTTPPQVKAQLEHRERNNRHASNGNGTTTLSDSALERHHGRVDNAPAVGVERIWRVIDKLTQPPLPLQAAE